MSTPSPNPESMGDDLRALAVGWLRGEIGSCPPERLSKAADRIEADTATIATLRGALERVDKYIRGCGGEDTIDAVLICIAAALANTGISNG